MIESATLKKVQHSAHKHAESDRTTFGFWVYLMTDCVLFATLFAVYAVLQNNIADGPSSTKLFDPTFALVETIILLTSSFICGLMVLAARRGDKKQVFTYLAVTAGLGAAFISMELYEFIHLVHEGHSWQQSAFLSSFFTLVGTHGIHILVGILWAISLGVQITKRGLSQSTMKRIGLFSLFWHFLDVIWIFIFTIVYMIGAL